SRARTAEDRVTPEDVLRNGGTVWLVLQKFSGPLIVGAVAVLVIALSAVGIAAIPQSSWQHAASIFTAVLSLFGLTAAAVTAKLKDSANSVLARLRSAIYADLVAAAATLLPDAEGRKVDRLARGRKLPTT